MPIRLTPIGQVVWDKAADCLKTKPWQKVPWQKKQTRTCRITTPSTRWTHLKRSVQRICHNHFNLIASPYNKMAAKSASDSKTKLWLTLWGRAGIKMLTTISLQRWPLRCKMGKLTMSILWTGPKPQQLISHVALPEIKSLEERRRDSLKINCNNPTGRRRLKETWA